MNRTIAVVALVLLCLDVSVQANVFKMGTGLTSLETVVVGNPSNKADGTGYGAVAYPFNIGKFEVTCAQYVEFLNAKAKSDPYGLYDDNILESGWGFKLERKGNDGAYTYSVEPNYANRPVVKITFWDACRFANWLHNGQGDGDTETGAYTLNGRLDLTFDDKGIVRRNLGAKWFVPSEDEWYKAAYYDPRKLGGEVYWDYPTRSNSVPNRDFSVSNSTNLNTGVLLSPVTTVVGYFGKSGSAYGTFDQGGNVSEWTESVELVYGHWNRCQRGGSFLLGGEDLLASSRDNAPPAQPDRLVGFRVAGTVNDDSGLIVAAAGAGCKPNPVVKADLWASPIELRSKKLIGAGGSLGRITPRFLADHPEFISRYPFDGVAVEASLDQKWCVDQGLVDVGTNKRDRALDELAFTNIPVPYTAVQEGVQDLKRVSWGSLTDNFLWFRLLHIHLHEPLDAADTRKRLTVDFSDDNAWSVVQENAVLAARICREANLKGFMLDTEQYTNYANGVAYPMGKDAPELVRKRGRQWMEAVQAEYPAIKIMIFFAWSPDVDQAEFLAGIRPFLNGILDVIKSPAKLIHAYENTFYYGMATNSRFSAEGVSGSRIRYQRTRESMEKWRILSSSSDKFDKFVDVGMAAWLESDPWNIDQGTSGSKNTTWSNVPLALAYSDEYAWAWSEFTDYAGTYANLAGPNPFLASLTNQTFNTGREAVTSITEDFTANPLLRGWYFDFDMLDVGRKKDPSHAVPIFSTDAVPYVWSKDDRAVRILGTWMTGPDGDKVAGLGQQRRRYVHPIQPLSRKKSFQANLDFRVDSFGSDSSNPIVMGLFNSDKLLNSQSITLQIGSSEDVRVVVVGKGKPWVSKLTVKGGLKTNTTYRLVFDYDGKAEFKATLKSSVDSSLLGQVCGVIPKQVGIFQLDELGAAQWDVGKTSTPVENAYRYRLERVTLQSK